MLDGGGVMVNSHESFQDPGEPMTTTVFVETDRVRIETAGEFGRSVMIFRGDKQTMWIVAPDQRTYQELTEEQIDRFGEQMGGMPMAAPATSKTEYSLVASDQQINQWTCDKYEGVRDGEKQREMWTVPPDEIGLEASDFEVMKQMAEFVKGFSKFGGGQADQQSLFRVGGGEGKDQDFSGVPVRQIEYQGGRPSSRSELKEVRREDFDSTLFEVPAGFKKQQMFGGPGKNPLQR